MYLNIFKQNHKRTMLMIEVQHFMYLNYLPIREYLFGKPIEVQHFMYLNELNKD